LPPTSDLPNTGYLPENPQGLTTIKINIDMNRLAVSVCLSARIIQLENRWVNMAIIVPLISLVILDTIGRLFTMGTSVTMIQCLPWLPWLP
jgi:hypothetical protein